MATHKANNTCTTEFPSVAEQEASNTCSCTCVVARGEADIVVAGGTEAAIIPVGLGGFVACRALSQRNDDPKTASRPWDQGREGFVMGEGAGVLVSGVQGLLQSQGTIRVLAHMQWCECQRQLQCRLKTKSEVTLTAFCHLHLSPPSELEGLCHEEGRPSPCEWRERVVTEPGKGEGCCRARERGGSLQNQGRERVAAEPGKGKG